MGLYRRDKIFWYTVTIKGRRHRESLDTTSRRQAEKFYAKILTDIVEGRYFDRLKGQSTTFRQLVEKYMERHEKSRDAHTIKKLLPVFGDMFLVDITTESIDDYRYERLKKVKPATVYQELSLMRRMYNVARREWKWVRDNPVADLSFAIGNKNARDRWLTLDEEQRLLACATNPLWLRNLLMVALHTGMRKGEILNLKWTDVNFKRRILTILISKNGVKRSIPLSKTLYQMLSDIKVRDFSGKVFPMSLRSLQVAYGKTLEKAKIEDMTFHDLRHTFATRLVQNGVDLYKVKELLGHKTIAMTMRYSHHYPESLRSSVEVLDTCHDSVTIGHNLGTMKTLQFDR